MTAYRGSDHYDQEAFLESYLQRRSWSENANDTLEKPIIYEMMGDVRRKSILDLGCGTATYGSELLELGASQYTGLEGSINMVEHARKTLDSMSNGCVIHLALEDWKAPEAAYDLVVSRLVIHYVEDIDALFSHVYTSLKAGGSFVFSVEHPVMTSSYGLPKPAGQKQDWTIDNYFVAGGREQEWLGRTVKKFHRTVEDYFSALQRAGFVVEQIRESRPDERHFSNRETYERRLRIPLFFMMKGYKKEGS
ncbi:methyltransferase domain-containing protein [Paenibacillus sp. N3/727]|uniref:class I SAM-dependent DNA methyltransferase n=1 Tax=Paenibacillus sp. N3/727 TaxID=2925845 RepID=UPI001F5383B7|nr:class I SAM-dependent methyltransferase [Paenibacillus sp. N3/727]UNK18652.1 methyltransferase domain-containing protein [Paenibacillus sp. N3/727]